MMMKSASGDQNFFYTSGQQIKNQKFYELSKGWQSPRWETGI
jgi:hypothetical protein